MTEADNNASDTDTGYHILTWIGAIILGMGLLTLTCICCFQWANRPLVSAPVQAAADILERLGAIGLRITRQEQGEQQMEVIVHGDKRASRLVTAEQQFRYSYEYSTTWMGSTKRLVLAADFVAYAGVDFERAPITLKLGTDINTLSAADFAGRGSLIACELAGIVLPELENEGLWNKLSPAEVASVIDLMKTAARRHIMERTDLLRMAEQNFAEYVKGQGCRPRKLPAGVN